MELKGTTILILGGSGLVGAAVARRLLAFQPRRLVLVGLEEHELRTEQEALQKVAGETDIEIASGNVFLPAAVAQMSREELAADPQARQLVLDDLIHELNPAILERSLLFQLFDRIRPDAVVDCINTATAFAYLDVFRSAQRLRAKAGVGPVSLEDVEEHLLAIPMLWLIRHMQITLEALRRAGTRAYVKIGTSGTGGMGFNIPYTHSEERPSRTLLTKSAIAGAHSLLLFLQGRTPDAPATVEIKPTAAVAWREIRHGPVVRWGKPIAKVDCPEPVPLARALAGDGTAWRELGVPLESVYADVGENGLFAREEFETVTALGQMEFITPEEIADCVVLELQGRPTGRNVVAALDAATAGPTYRAGVLRHAALGRLAELEAEHGTRSIAFEMLGPPRLSKLLYEAYVLSRLCETVEALARSAAADVARAAARLVQEDAELRRTVISVGLPILVEQELVYRGPTIVVPVVGGDVERAVAAGWVDLRRANCEVWIRRAQAMIRQVQAQEACTGSAADWDPIAPDGPIRPAAFVTWIFRREDQGERMKR